MYSNHVGFMLKLSVSFILNFRCAILYFALCAHLPDLPVRWRGGGPRLNARNASAVSSPHNRTVLRPFWRSHRSQTEVKVYTSYLVSNFIDTFLLHRRKLVQIVMRAYQYIQRVFSAPLPVSFTRKHENLYFSRWHVLSDLHHPIM